MKFFFPESLGQKHGYASYTEKYGILIIATISYMSQTPLVSTNDVIDV